MKKIFGIALFGLFLTSFSFSQIKIDDVCKTFAENKVTTGDFKQEKKSAKLKRPLKSSGKFIFAESGIVWQTVKPFPSSMVVTKDAIIQTGTDGKSSVIDGNSNETFKNSAAMLVSIFSGDRKVLEEHFTISEFKSDAKSWLMKLTPKDSTISSVLNDITVGGEIKNSKVEFDSIVIRQNTTDTTSYKLSNQIHKTELSKEEKAFFTK